MIKIEYALAKWNIDIYIMFILLIAYHIIILIHLKKNGIRGKYKKMRNWKV